MALVIVVYFLLESGYSNGYFFVAKMKEKCPIVSSTSKGISHFPSPKKGYFGFFGQRRKGYS